MNKGKIICIHQPTFLPWIGWFDLIDQADELILLDDVKFSKQSWQQRNNIISKKGLELITIPVIKPPLNKNKINQKNIFQNNFYIKHLKSIEMNYSKSKYFNLYFDEFSKIYTEGYNSKKLSIFLIKMLKWLFAIMEIKTNIILSSQIEYSGNKSAMLVSLCKNRKVNKYISTSGATKYLNQDLNLFNTNNIEVFIHKYLHPTYKQLSEEFISHASVIDLLFNEGPASRLIIKSGREKPYKLI